MPLARSRQQQHVGVHTRAHTRTHTSWLCRRASVLCVCVHLDPGTSEMDHSAAQHLPVPNSQRGLFYNRTRAVSFFEMKTKLGSALKNALILIIGILPPRCVLLYHPA